MVAARVSRRLDLRDLWAPRASAPISLPVGLMLVAWVGAGYVCYYVVEQPLMDWPKRFRAAGAAPVTVVPKVARRAA